MSKGNEPALREKVRSLAREAVKDIVCDLDDRRGLGAEWSACDADIKKEIKRVWTNRVELALHALLEALAKDGGGNG